VIAQLARMLGQGRACAGDRTDAARRHPRGRRDSFYVRIMLAYCRSSIAALRSNLPFLHLIYLLVSHHSLTTSEARVYFSMKSAIVAAEM